MTLGMSTKKKVGIRIKVFREARGWSQEQLAERTDRSVRTISTLEQGVHLPNFNTLEKLSKALKVPIHDFFDFRDNESEKRTAMIAEITDTARSLSEAKLKIATDQIKALAKRGE